jgi:branched-chain amino acid transport system permease protein
MTTLLAQGGQLPLGAVTFGLFEQLLVSGVVIGSSYALVAVSFGIIYSTTRVFHFAHSVVYAGTAYAAVVATDNLGLPLLPAAIVGLLVAVVLGLLIETVFYRPMRKAGATLLGIFLVSLGITIAAPNLLQIIFGPVNKPLPGFNVHTHSLGSVTYTNLDMLTVALAWALISILIVFQQRTKFGRAITAVRTNREMAAAVGISPGSIYLLVFGVGSLLVGIASLLFTVNGVASPQMGLEPVLTGFIAVFLGGIGSTGGAALGGLVLGLASNLSGLWLSSDFSPAVVFSILFVFLIVRPQGLLGKVAT